MSEEKSVVSELVGQTSGVLEKAYDDLAHPTAKSVGNTVSLIPRTIGVWLGKWEKWVINGEESIRLTAEAVREKAAKIPEEKLSEPEPYVAIPAVQQLSYCYDSKELREMYANLLVSSMNTDTKQAVHPSFVDIIKQMSPDEAKLLKSIKENTSYIPLVDLNIELGVGKGHVPFLKNYTNLGEGVCDTPHNISAYIENLDRLKLISIIDEIHMMDRSLYGPLESSSYFMAYKNLPLPEGKRFSIKQKSFIVTSFGKKFIDTCIE